MNQSIFVEKILPSGIVRKLTEDEMDHYREPFTMAESRKPVWAWPNEIPIGAPADVYQIITKYSNWLKGTEIPKLLIHANPSLLIDISKVKWVKQI